MVQRQLGAELRRLREQTHKTSKEIAHELGWSDSKLSRIETARIGVSSADLDRLCKRYQVDAATRERLRELARQSRQRAWWEAYGNVLLDQYEAYIGYESEASSICGYYPLIVPGLLQTDEYARAVTAADGASDEPDVEKLVQVKMARQAILSRQPPPRFQVILDEAVVRRMIGGPNVMRRQLDRLLAQGERDNISVQVLPLAAGAHAGLTSGMFVLMELPEGLGGPLVYCEGMTGGVIRQDPDEYRKYERSFRAMEDVTLSPEESRKFLKTVLG